MLPKCLRGIVEESKTCNNTYENLKTQLKNSAAPTQTTHTLTFCSWAFVVKTLTRQASSGQQNGVFVFPSSSAQTQPGKFSSPEEGTIHRPFLSCGIDTNNVTTTTPNSCSTVILFSHRVFPPFIPARDEVPQWNISLNFITTPDLRIKGSDSFNIPFFIHLLNVFEYISSTGVEIISPYVDISSTTHG